jgi:RNA polymerase sigma factor (sigma-70 family)
MKAFWLAFASLTSRERKVLALRVRHRKDFDEIARSLGVTHERARQIEARGLEKLRQRFAMDGASLHELLPG